MYAGEKNATLYARDSLFFVKIINSTCSAKSEPSAKKEGTEFYDYYVPHSRDHNVIKSISRSPEVLHPEVLARAPSDEPSISRGRSSRLALVMAPLSLSLPPSPSVSPSLGMAFFLFG